MLIDILGQSNIVQFNSMIANKIGLNGAIYLSELLSQYSLNKNNNKLINDYFIIDRENIYTRTTLTEQTQQELDILLVRFNILLKRPSEIDPLSEEINLNMTNFLNIFANNDEKLTNELKKFTKSRSGKMTQRDKYKLDLKSKITCSNAELLRAYRDWIDGVYANPKGFLSPTAIKVFQKTVDDFAKGDLDLALKIIELATINGYRDATWAINLFNKSYKEEFERQFTVKNDLPRKVMLSSEVF